MLVKPHVFEFLDGYAKFAQGDALRNLQIKAYKDVLPIISREVSGFLTLLLKMNKPSRILEIGCAVGFSAALFNEVLPDAQITTIERFDPMIMKAKENFKILGIADKIRLLEGDAIDIMPKLAQDGEKFDFVFMDCAKGQYIRFLPYILRLLEVGGVMCVDDCLQKGTLHRKLEDVPRRQRTTHRNLKEFLDVVMADKCLNSMILPIGDGLLVSLKEREDEADR
ncbi:MAG: O-methyltransferase [Defluviitaleaceae bacterium]|nr:O-methyltransferase [Defluviitaleaceae bacterium]